jgi:type I restriction enzyme, S subunit
MNKNSWTIKKLGEISELQSGNGFPVEFQGKTEGDYPFAKVGDISNIARSGSHLISDANHWLDKDVILQIKAKVFPEGSIVFAKIGEAIKQNFRVISSCPMLFDNNVMGIKPKISIVDTEYLFFYLKQVDFYSLSEKTTVPSIRKSKIETLEIPLPPIEEQKRIAAILDKADRVRRKRQEAIRLTEELGRSIFLDMFGDPVTNPKGWEVAPLSKFGEIFTGNTPPRADPENFGDCIEWIKSDNITTPYHFLTEASEKLSSIGKKKGRIVPPGSILVCCIAGSKSSIGRAAIADREVSFNQQINAIVPNKSVDTYFLYSQFWVAQNLVQLESTDSMKGLVNKSKFSGIQFLKPPLSKQIEFREKFLKFIGINKRFEVSLCESENLFNSLLQRAFRGEL